MSEDPTLNLPQDYQGTLRVGDRNELMFIPNVYPSKQIRTLGFTRWDGKAWHQSRPSITKQAIEDVRNLFGKIAVSTEIEQLLNVADVTLPTEIAEHPMLFDFQKEAIQFMLSKKRVLVALAPGLGKTACGIFAAQAAGCKRVLVISPLSLLHTWRNEIKKWLGVDAAIVYKKQIPVPSSFTLTNYDTLRIRPSTFEGENWDCIIVDESILIKHRNTARTKVVSKIVADAKPKYCWLLSGAPVSRLYTDMFPQLKILDPQRFTSYWRFAEKYCIIEASQWSQYNLVANQADAGERIVKDLADMYFARSQNDVLDLPEFIFDDVHVPMTKEQDKLYGEMEDTFVAELDEDTKLLAPNVLAQVLRLVQFASNPVLVGGVEKSSKWNACQEMLEYETGPFIIWTNFIDTATRMAEHLGEKYRVAKLTGATKPEERQSIVDKFQNGELDIIVAHPQVGKFGLTLTAARTAIYLERGYNGDDYFQSLHRVRRIGTTQSPHIIHILSDRADGSGTVDHVIGKILSGRKDMVDKITHMGLKDAFREVKK
jgi:SNF2 family DNA or RNA helicase